ncbi:MAG: DUF4258 domain-containing protein [Caldilineaceae bacterium]|nr:DUF4258 domain-containing protein [Caldilineaceae bacterium]
MRTIAEIRRQLMVGDFEFSQHAFRRAVERNISESEIREAGESAQVIEDYPADKYSPSCLLLGFTRGNRALHLQVSRAETELTKIITLYEPTRDEWYADLTRRR